MAFPFGPRLLLPAFVLLLLSGCGGPSGDGGADGSTMTHTPGMTHEPGMTHGPGSGIEATEAGQSAFAAIQEIVAQLEADPATDWSRVNVTALRDHLADMDAVVLRTRVVQEDTPSGFRATVGGEPAVVAAAGRMLREHVAALAPRTEWSFTVDTQPDQVVLNASGLSAADAAELQALGVYGVLATDSHHQVHHVAIALGQPMHGS